MISRNVLCVLVEAPKRTVSSTPPVMVHMKIIRLLLPSFRVLRSHSPFCFDSLRVNLCKTLVTACDVAVCRSRPTIATYDLTYRENPTKNSSENSLSLAGNRTEYTLDANPKPHISRCALLEVRSAKRRAVNHNTSGCRRKQTYKHRTPLRTAVILPSHTAYEMFALPNTQYYSNGP